MARGAFTIALSLLFSQDFEKSEFMELVQGFNARDLETDISCLFRENWISDQSPVDILA